MIYRDFNLADRIPALIGKSNAYVQCYMHEESDRLYPSVVICPGGGYEETSEREADPVAKALFEQGFNAYALRYSCVPAIFPSALTELFLLISMLRGDKNLGADPKKIAVMGFSAGGHLAACAGTMWNGNVAKSLFEDTTICRPNAMALCYPVISFTEKDCCASSFEHLIGGELTETTAEFLSLENRVDETTPPTYIFHTANDPCVPVINSLRMATALSAYAVPYELHIFKNGAHGLSLATEVTAEKDYWEQHINPDVARWFDECVDFLCGVL